MTVFNIIVGVMLLSFVLWIQSRGGRSWSGGWPGRTPNVVGSVILLGLVVWVVITILSR